MTSEDQPGRQLFGSDKTDGIVFTPRTLPTEDQELLDVSNAVLGSLGENLDHAASLSDFMHNYYALGVVHRRSLDAWRFSLGRERTLEKGLGGVLSENLKERAQLDAKVAEELETRFDGIPQEDGQILITLKRIRDPHDYYTYGILARFPDGIDVDTLGGAPDKDSATPDMSYYAPQTACAMHAADDLFKLYRKEPFRVPYKSRREAMRTLTIVNGAIHYVLDSSSGRTVKQNAVDYILVGLHGGYSNEPYVAPVSRFKGPQESA